MDATCQEIRTLKMRPADFLSATAARIEEVKHGILGAHLGSVDGPEVWGVAVEAYCVLAHAAFEEFVEAVSDFAAGQIEACLLGFKPNQPIDGLVQIMIPTA